MWLSRKKVAVLLTALVVALSVSGVALAQEATLERIFRTGEIRIGMREAAPPFAFVDETGRHAGFSVDLAYVLADR